MTDKGKHLVRHYNKTYDAQAVYRELEKHAIILIMFQIELNQKTNYVFRFWFDLKDIFQCFDCYELYDT